MSEKKQVTFTIDDQTVTVPEGTLVVDAARTLGIQIPVFCSHHRLNPLGACRICLVEKVGAPKPVIACAEVAAEGMHIRTQSDLAVQARSGIMEYLLVNHPLDCPVCDEGGECDLQDTSYTHGMGSSRYVELKRSFEKVDLGPIVVLDRNRCIVCSRCVRYCNDIMGDSALTMEERGFTSQINTKDGGPLECQQCGNCIEICPVGALTSRPYRFKARPWDLKQTETVCTYCSNGCTMHLGRMASKVVRARAKRSKGVNRDFLCARGRYGYEFISGDSRLKHPRVFRNGELQPVDWNEAAVAFSTAVESARASGKAIAGLASARLSNEALYLFQRLLREALDSAHIDHRTQVRQALSGATLSRLAAFPAVPVDAIGTAGSVLVFGEDLTEEQPLYGSSVMRECNYRSLPLVLVHSRELALSSKATARVLHRSGAELAAARAMLKAAAANAKSAEASRAGAAKLADAWSWESLEAGTGRTRADFELAADTLLGAGPRLVFFGSQVLRHPEAEAITLALTNLAVVCGAELSALWEKSNSQGALDLGVLPDLAPGYAVAAKKGWGTQEILKRAAAGEVGVLILAGQNPLASHPDRKLVDSALHKVDFLVVTELFDTETTAEASLVLPAASFAESDGSVTNAERRIQALRSAAPMPGEARPDWQIFVLMAQSVGRDWKYPDLRSVQEELHAKVPLYRGLGRRVGPAAAQWVLPGSRPADLVTVPEGTAVAAPAAGRIRVEAGNSIFQHGSLTRHTPVLVDLLPEPVLYLHASDAARLGVAEGGRVQMDAAGAPMEAQVRVGGPSAPGVAFYPDHFAGAEANRFLGPERAYADLKLVPLGTAVHA